MHGNPLKSPRYTPVYVGFSVQGRSSNLSLLSLARVPVTSVEAGCVWGCCSPPKKKEKKSKTILSDIYAKDHWIIARDIVTAET